MAACDIMDTVQGTDGLVFSQGDEIHPGICVLCQGCSPFGTLVFALRETLTSQKCHNAIESVLCIMEKALRAFDLMK